MSASQLFVGLNQIDRDPILRQVFPAFLVADRIIQSIKKPVKRKDWEAMLRELSIPRTKAKRDLLAARADGVAKRRLGPKYNFLDVFTRADLNAGKLTPQGEGTPFVLARFKDGSVKVDVIATATAWIAKLHKAVEIALKFGDSKNIPWLKDLLHAASNVVNDGIVRVSDDSKLNLVSHDGLFRGIAHAVKLALPRGSGINETYPWHGRQLAQGLVKD